jgi:flavin reductase (DIM6/NTAB) family NADH-FMN oxidoreductase RutF
MDTTTQTAETPMTVIDPREFRNTMGRFATGVTIVTTEVNGETRGMTANAFLSVSLDPPLVLVSMGNNSNMNKLLPQAMRYGVSFLAQSQQQLSQHFAGKPVEGLQVPFVRKAEMNVIDGALAHIVARVVDVFVAGDHTLYIGQVEHLSYNNEKPLVFFAGKYREITGELA